MGKKLVIVADDLTGAGDTGVQFTKSGLVVKVIIGMESFREEIYRCDVLVIDLETRMDAAKVAFEKCYSLGLLIREVEDVLVYKKVDSTLRGNIGAEIDGLMEALGVGVTLFAPALPAGGRTVVNGEVYVRGAKLADTEFAADPRAPVKHSAVEEIVGAQSGRACYTVKTEVLRMGVTSAVTMLRQRMLIDDGIYIFDSREERDLEDIAGVAEGVMNGSVLVAGSSGLARYLGRGYGVPVRKEPPAIRGGVFFVFAGSVSSETQAQVRYVCGRGDSELVHLKGPDEENFVAVTESVNHLLARGCRRLALATSLSKEDVREDAAMMASVLGRLAALLIRTFHPSGVLLTGGETAIQTLYALGATGIRVVDEVLPGIQYGHLTGEDVPDCVVVTKAGGFGEEDTILKILEFFNV